MKSYSNFIIEKKKGQTVASPAPGDPLDPKGRRKIEKKFSNPSNPPKVPNPEVLKSRPSRPKGPAPKPEAVNQADVSKQAARYRRAERVKGATGGKTTGSLSKGNLSFPGDRSGATARVKSDIEARKGFSGSKSGGLKADEANPNVNRSVRQQRTVKQGIPDPFKSKTPAPADPFKGVASTKPVKPSMPDPFKGSASVPPKPKKPGAPERPATRQAVSDIRASRKRLGVTKSFTPKPSTPKPSIPKPPKTVPQTPANEYIRTMQDQGRSVDPDFVGPQGLKASGAKPEMVGGPTAPKGTGSQLFSRTRAKGDAVRDISKARDADLDKALKNLINTGDVTKSKPSGPSSSIGFKQFSMKADKVTQKTKDAAARSAAAGYSQSNKPKAGSAPVVYKPKKDPVNDFYRTTGGSRQPKVVNPSTNKPEFKNTGRSGYKPEFKPKAGSSPVPSKPGDINLAGPSKGTPKFSSKSTGSELAKKSWGQFSIDSGRGGSLAKNNNIIDVDVKVDPPKQPAALPGTPPKPKKQSSLKLPPARKTPALAAAAKNAPVTKGMLRQMGGRALGLAGSAYDAVSSYQEYKKRGDSDLRAGVKSAFRTGLGYAGGALGGLAGAIGGGGIGSAVTGTAGAIGGYSAGTWLADKILGATRYERKKRAREKAAAKAAANQK